MVVTRMRIRLHCTIDLRDNSGLYRHKTGKVSAVPFWQGSGPRLASLVDSTFPEHEDDCMEAYPLTTDKTGDLSPLLDYRLLGTILAICVTFTVMVAFQA